MKTDTCIVHWPLGAGGAFLTSIIYALLNPEFTLTNNFGSTGDSHPMLEVCEGTWTKESSDRHYNGRVNKIPSYETIEREENSKFLMLTDHIPPDYDKLFSLYPNCKNVVITVDQRMLPRAAGAFFYKVNAFNTEFWKGEIQKFSYLSEISHPFDMPMDIAEKYISDSISWYPLYTFYTDNYITPYKYENSVLRISYHDMIHDKEKILNRLSDFFESTITTNIVEYYDAYLDKQEELIKTKLPWINDK